MVLQCSKIDFTLADQENEPFYDGHTLPCLHDDGFTTTYLPQIWISSSSVMRIFCRLCKKILKPSIDILLHEDLCLAFLFHSFIGPRFNIKKKFRLCYEPYSGRFVSSLF